MTTIKLTSSCNAHRVEKSLHHIATVAKFLDDNKPKPSLKSEFALFQTSSILFSFIEFVKCWQNFVGLNPKVQYLSLEKEIHNFCGVVFTNSKGRAREIRKFHVAVVSNDG